LYDNLNDITSWKGNDFKRLTDHKKIGAANMGFAAASVAGRCKHQQQIAVRLQFGLDGMLLGFWFLTCTFSSSISSGSGQTEY
jgi:hypothetical protein